MQEKAGKKGRKERQRKARQSKAKQSQEKNQNQRPSSAKQDRQYNTTQRTQINKPNPFLLPHQQTPFTIPKKNPNTPDPTYPKHSTQVEIDLYEIYMQDIDYRHGINLLTHTGDKMSSIYVMTTTGSSFGIRFLSSRFISTFTAEE
ncbi:uncharacterized protein EAE98_002827 [Botrytis deweyae]|uniref:Uncharacterized protein n=1 Tax=Botrytis deweyae TaxID=2478750 RepID=A0ABQ7IV01_9HELO|nr:uncharacterized protein EAE98_002827 [Botrytis deweyae]KAF7934782.1 hypothetical protein EAE98_002827 [Botrytis deweyae]